MNRARGELSCRTRSSASWYGVGSNGSGRANEAPSEPPGPASVLGAVVTTCASNAAPRAARQARLAFMDRMLAWNAAAAHPVGAATPGETCHTARR